MATQQQSCSKVESASLEDMKRAVELIHQSKYAVALTGAGHSTPSGIPDFRSPRSGLWERVNPMEVASIYGFRRDPQKFFEWVRPLVKHMQEAAPNPAHYALARLEALGYLKAVITQNIDTLHTRAGSKKVYEVHGHMREATCVECFQVYPSDELIRTFLETGEIPRCPEDNGILKPNVVLFGEALPYQVLQDAQRVARECDLMIVAGSSLEVAPVSELPLVALAHGAEVIIINYEATYMDKDAALVIDDNVATVLPCIVDLLEERIKGK